MATENTDKNKNSFFNKNIKSRPFVSILSLLLLIDLFPSIKSLFQSIVHNLSSFFKEPYIGDIGTWLGSIGTVLGLFFIYKQIEEQRNQLDIQLKNEKESTFRIERPFFLINYIDTNKELHIENISNKSMFAVKIFFNSPNEFHEIHDPEKFNELHINKKAIKPGELFTLPIQNFHPSLSNEDSIIISVYYTTEIRERIKLSFKLRKTNKNSGNADEYSMEYIVNSNVIPNPKILENKLDQGEDFNKKDSNGHGVSYNRYTDLSNFKETDVYKNTNKIKKMFQKKKRH